MNIKTIAKAAEEVAAKKGCTRSEVSGYEIAQHLGVSDGGAFYATFRAWQEEERLQGQASSAGVDPEVAANLKTLIEQSDARLLAAILEAMRDDRARVDGNAALRIQDVEQRYKLLSSQMDRVIAVLRATEQERNAARAERDEARHALDEAGRERLLLEGRLLQREADTKAESAEVAATPNAVVQSATAAVAQPEPPLPPDQNGYDGGGHVTREAMGSDESKQSDHDVSSPPAAKDANRAAG